MRHRTSDPVGPESVSRARTLRRWRSVCVGVGFVADERVGLALLIELPLRFCRQLHLLRGNRSETRASIRLSAGAAGQTIGPASVWQGNLRQSPRIRGVPDGSLPVLRSSNVPG